ASSVTAIDTGVARTRRSASMAPVYHDIGSTPERFTSFATGDPGALKRARSGAHLYPMHRFAVGFMLLALAGCRTNPPATPPVPKPETGPRQPPPNQPQVPVEQQAPTRTPRPPATPTPPNQRLWN